MCPLSAVRCPLSVCPRFPPNRQKLLKYCIKSITRAVKNCLLNSHFLSGFFIGFFLTFIYCSNLFALSPGCLNVGGFRLSEEPKFWATACVLYSGNYMGFFFKFLIWYEYIPFPSMLWKLGTILVRIKRDSFNYMFFFVSLHVVIQYTLNKQ